MKRERSGGGEDRDEEKEGLRMVEWWDKLCNGRAFSISSLQA